jgi:hypothetical protein
MWGAEWRVSLEEEPTNLHPNLHAHWHGAVIVLNRDPQVVAYIEHMAGT